jgi:hypothetical protein
LRASAQTFDVVYDSREMEAMFGYARLVKAATGLPVLPPPCNLRQLLYPLAMRLALSLYALGRRVRVILVPARLASLLSSVVMAMAAVVSIVVLTLCWYFV